MNAGMSVVMADPRYFWKSLVYALLAGTAGLGDLDHAIRLVLIPLAGIIPSADAGVATKVPRPMDALSVNVLVLQYMI
jgi:hypothetical protein